MVEHGGAAAAPLAANIVAACLTYAQVFHRERVGVRVRLSVRVSMRVKMRVRMRVREKGRGRVRVRVRAKVRGAACLTYAQVFRERVVCCRPTGPSSRRFGGLALRHGSLKSLFQVALHLLS